MADGVRVAEFFIDPYLRNYFSRCSV